MASIKPSMKGAGDGDPIGKDRRKKRAEQNHGAVECHCNCNHRTWFNHFQTRGSIDMRV